MCGRFALFTPAEVIAEVFGIEGLFEVAPRYNVAPTQSILGVRADGGRRRLDPYRWGLVPPWSKGPGDGPLLLNARGDTVASKPSFRTAFRKKRLLVPADGFYEWKKEGKAKQPWLFRRMDRRPLALGGLWEKWTDVDGTAVISAAIITTEPNDVVSPCHDRMPVIVPEAHWDLWLDPNAQDPERILPLVRPFPAEQMDGVPVSPRVNKADYDAPDCVEPLPAR